MWASEFFKMWMATILQLHFNLCKRLVIMMTSLYCQLSMIRYKYKWNQISWKLWSEWFRISGRHWRTDPSRYMRCDVPSRTWQTTNEWQFHDHNKQIVYLRGNIFTLFHISGSHVIKYLHSALFLNQHKELLHIYIC